MHEYRSILALNGTIAESLSYSLPIIAADGAADTLIARGIYPQLIVGDLDSVSDSAKQVCECIHIPEQDTSDFQKALCIMQKRDLLPAIVVGLNGGYLDHILHNINIFAETRCLFYDPPIMGFMIYKGEKRVLSLPNKTKISLIGLPEASIHTYGLQWNLNDERLTFPGKSSCFNRTVEETCTIHVTDGALFVLVYMHPIKDAGWLP